MGLFSKSADKCYVCGAALPEIITGGGDRIDDLQKRSEINLPQYRALKLCHNCSARTSRNSGYSEQDQRAGEGSFARQHKPSNLPPASNPAVITGSPRPANRETAFETSYTDSAKSDFVKPADWIMMLPLLLTTKGGRGILFVLFFMIFILPSMCQKEREPDRLPPELSRYSDGLDNPEGTSIIPKPPVSAAGSKQRATPLGNPGAWVSSNDYPRLASQQNIEGTTAFTLMVRTDGRVSQCIIKRSSGHAALDEATCSKLTRRARFNPALDNKGNAIESEWSSQLRWQIPE